MAANDNMGEYGAKLFQALKSSDPKKQCENLNRIMDEENRKHAELFMHLDLPPASSKITFASGDGACQRRDFELRYEDQIGE